MSKYTLLIILNAPIILAGLIRSIVAIKLKHTHSTRGIIRIVIWLLSLLVIVFAQQIYTYLIESNLTDSDPLSLFDVAQITSIIFTFFIALRAYNKAEIAEQKNIKLHQELSILLADKQ